MLVLTRREQERIVIDNDIIITVLGVDKNGQVRIGIDAPKSRKIMRGELIEEVIAENEHAAALENAASKLSQLNGLLPNIHKRNANSNIKSNLKAKLGKES